MTSYGFAGFGVALIEKDKLEFILNHRLEIGLLLALFTFVGGILDLSFLDKKSKWLKIEMI